jgi:hypothetical protein
MNNRIKRYAVALMAVLAFAAASTANAVTFTSAAELKAWLDAQPAK